MSGQAKHTPGPWVTHPRFPTYVVPKDHADRPIGGHSLSAEDLRIYAQEISIGVRSDRHRSHEEQEANARLIAAAPDLLAALRALLEAWPEGHLPAIQTCMLAANAIAKAEGRSDV